MEGFSITTGTSASAIAVGAKLSPDRPDSQVRSQGSPKTANWRENLHRSAPAVHFHMPIYTTDSRLALNQ
jgi:hypothetical protein